jgi:hypothetical protein
MKKKYTKNNNKYRNGVIYKIIHINMPEIIYIGSTMCRLTTRYKRHKKGYYSWLKGYTSGKCSICPYFKQYGIKNFKCIELKKYKVTCVKQLSAYEQLWFNKIKNINKNNVFSPNKFYNKYYKKNLKLLENLSIK